MDFYWSKDDEAEILSRGKEWSFVMLAEAEKDSFDRPENRLESGSLILYRDGTGFYKTCGKHTGEEFCTAELPFGKIPESM